ncbi:MAG: ribonuclease R [Pseudomonadota bacterium]
MTLSRDSILAAVRQRPDHYDRKRLARYLGVKGEDRRTLRQTLRELVDDGALVYTPEKTYRLADALPGVMVVNIVHIDDDGDMWGDPERELKGGVQRSILIRDTSRKRDDGGALGVGHRALVRIKESEDGTAVGHVLKRLGKGAQTHMGVLFKTDKGWRIQPVSKKARHDYGVDQVPDTLEDGAIVMFRSTRKNRGQLRLAEVRETIGNINDERAASLISLHENDIPIGFPPAAVEQAETATMPDIGEIGHDDLRHLPLLTIDPVDAKDFDDAILAEPDEDPKNPGGWSVWVAIADVAAFVGAGSPLDKAAWEKGNSVYLPDRVEPMLPHELSSDLCSLRPNEDRASMLVNMIFDSGGNKIRHKFHRGIIRSRARLTYRQAQDAFEGQNGPESQDVLPELSNLYACYKALRNAREQREPLEIELPERRVKVDESGKVVSITVRDRFDAHKLVEEFMVQANVAAAEALSQKGVRTLMRFHDTPERQRVSDLSEFLPALNLKFSAGDRITPKRFNALLRQAEAKDLTETVGMAVLRTQAQAFYSSDKMGHFGLNLTHYAHFTSPIRRYADLIVHRALIKAFKLGDGGTTKEEESRLSETGEHISATERRAMVAERDAVDRYIAAYLKDRVGGTFRARITGVTKFGLFVTLSETGADGLIPISELGREYFALDEKTKSVVGVESGTTFKFGREVQVKLKEATPVTGGLIFGIISKGEPGKPPKGASRGRGSYHSGKKGGRGAKHKRRRRG